MRVPRGCATGLIGIYLFELGPEGSRCNSMLVLKVDTSEFALDVDDVEDEGVSFRLRGTPSMVIFGSSV